MRREDYYFQKWNIPPLEFDYFLIGTGIKYALESPFKFRLVSPFEFLK